MNKQLVAHRSLMPDDEAFIMSTWLKGLYYGNSWFRQIPQDTFFDAYRDVITRLAASSEIKVACLADDPDVILGYSVSSGPILHWVFVKQAWRKLGLAKDLVNPRTYVTTHMTTVGQAIKPKDWIFNPFLI